MTVWIITTGSSDVQLNNTSNWNRLLGKVRSQSGMKTITPSNEEHSFTVPARAMGIVYGQPDASQYFGDLVFPLLDNFVSKIQSEKLSQIILILTDQVNVFSASEKNSMSSPFWQDTSTLQPILKKYLNDRYPEAEIIPRVLQPESQSKGLDDWDSVFELVQRKLSELSFPDDGTVYVSHQAGTPAISSAIQFASLARFGQRVKFLVSSARDATLTRVLETSAYLKGFQLQEAKALLKRFDYAGVKVLLGETGDKKIDVLLDAAIFWGFAEFKKFAEKLKDTPVLDQLSQRATDLDGFWWRSAYESAYLAVIRLEQENTTEAMFHSFRAVEGLLKKYVEYLATIPGTGVTLEGRKIKFQHTDQIKKYNDYGKHLYDFIKDYKNINDLSLDIHEFGENIFDIRNEIFHNLVGLESKDSVFGKWNTSTEDEWKNRVLGCLNFISGQSFSSLGEASLMVQVHQQLESDIASLAQTSDY